MSGGQWLLRVKFERRVGGVGGVGGPWQVAFLKQRGCGEESRSRELPLTDHLP